MKLMFVPALARVFTPCPPLYGNLKDVRPDASGRVWVGGYDGSFNNLTLWWDGLVWHQVLPGAAPDGVYRLSLGPDGEFWAVSFQVFQLVSGAWVQRSSFLGSNTEFNGAGLASGHFHKSGDSTITGELPGQDWDGTSWSPANDGRTDGTYSRESQDTCTDSAGNIWVCGVALTSGAAHQFAWVEKNNDPFGVYYISSHANSILHRVWALSPTNVYASGSWDYPAFFHYGGSGWSLYAEHPAVSAQGFYGADGVDGDLWGCGDRGGKLWACHYDGATWIDYAMPGDPSGTLWGIRRVAANDVWACGETIGVLYVSHWDGVSWTDVSPCDTYYPNLTLSAELDLNSSTCLSTMSGQLVYENLASFSYSITYHYELWYDLDGDGFLDSQEIVSPDVTRTIPGSSGPLSFPLEGPYGPSITPLSGVGGTIFAEVQCHIAFTDGHTIMLVVDDYAQSCA